ncbi:unnamed protein product [Phytomonas sp. EM1]|nr:unnamed protein product [Phytomonas sp. EM1]|eukprot:CCW62649.1 unnamed protein product [Phytomonas sp. isolate EM1]
MLSWAVIFFSLRYFSLPCKFRLHELIHFCVINYPPIRANNYPDHLKLWETDCNILEHFTLKAV